LAVQFFLVATQRGGTATKASFSGLKPLAEVLVTAGLKPGPPRESKFYARRREFEDRQ